MSAQSSRAGAHLRKPNYTSRFVTALMVVGLCAGLETRAQQYELFELTGGDIYWRNTYEYTGTQDSLRREVVQMLKSKFYTFNVIRNQTGYNGEISHYVVDCRRYGRRYGNTPRIYWDGEWTGKFIVDV